MASISEILTAESKTDHSVRMYPEGTPVEAEIDEQQFQQWKSEQVSRQELPGMAVPFTMKPTPPPSPPPVLQTADKDEAEVLQRLRTFNLAGSTPMETMLFVSELQRMLNKGKGTSV